MHATHQRVIFALVDRDCLGIAGRQITVARVQLKQIATGVQAIDRHRGAERIAVGV